MTPSTSSAPSHLMALKYGNAFELGLLAEHRRLALDLITFRALSGDDAAFDALFARARATALLPTPVLTGQYARTIRDYHRGRVGVAAGVVDECIKRDSVEARRLFVSEFADRCVIEIQSIVDILHCDPPLTLEAVFPAVPELVLPRLATLLDLDLVMADSRPFLGWVKPTRLGKRFVSHTGGRA